jgi:PAS domain S-box-containing protein
MPRATSAGPNIAMIVLVTALTMALFVMDTILPLGFAAGVLYIPAVLLAQQTRIRDAAFIFAAVGTVLTILGFYFSPSGDVAAGAVLANRGLAVFAIWITAFIVHQREAVRSSLQAREDSYGALVKTQSELVCRYLPNGVLTFVNDAYWRKFSVNNENLIGRRFIDLIALEGRAEAERVLAELGTGSAPHTYVRRVVTRNNEVSYVQWTRQAILGDDGRIVEYQAVGRDISDLKRTETALRRSEELYRTLVQTQEELICRYLPNGILTFVNDAFCRNTGKTREQLIGRNFLALLAPGDRPMAEETLAAEADHMAATSFERRFQNKSGEIRHVQWTRLPICDDRGRLVEFQAVGRDITDLKRAETALRESEVLHRGLLEISPDAVIIQCEGKIVLANPAAVTLFAADSPADLLGREHLEFVRPEHHESVLELRRKLLHEGAGPRLTAIRYVRLDGGEFVANSAGAPFHWGDKPAVLVVIHDTTALHEAQAALRKSEELHRRLLDVSPDAIMVHCEGRIVFANPAAVTLLRAESEDEIVGRLAVDFVHSDDHAMVLKNRNLTPNNRRLNRLESVRLLPLDGTEINCESSGAPFLWEDKSASLVILRDMTALREAERNLVKAKEAAEQANTAKSRFLAAASHDLRQPIYALSIFVATLARRVRNPKSRDLIDKMEQAIDSTNKLLVAVLDISKLEAEVVEPNMADFSVRSVFNEIATEFAPSAEARGNVLRFVPTRLAVKSDRVLLESILRNLVSNAVRYTSSGSILVGCRRRGDRVQFEVRDSGIGIARDKQEEIFEEFHRLEGTAEPGDTGLGLGLAIVDRTAKLLGYRIELKSEPGKGSLFRFSVPAGEAEAGVDDVTHLVPPSLLRGANVAIIDDDRELLDAMGQQLAGWGCYCIGAESTESVVEELTLANKVPDLIVADFHLADGKTGIEAVQEIRRRWGTNVPAIIVTADDSSEPARRAEELHLPLMLKPVRAARMRALLLHILQMREEAEPKRAIRH